MRLRIKNRLKILVILLAMLTLSLVTFADEEITGITEITEITVTVNGEVVEFPDQEPMIQNSRTIVPIRFIAEELGASVGWDSDTWTVSIELGQLDIQMPIDDKTVKVNGESKVLDQEAVLIGSRTYVPVRFISEELGATVGWDGDTWTVSISTSEDVTPVEPAEPIETEVVDSDIYFMDNGREIKTSKNPTNEGGAAIFEENSEDLPRDAYQYPYILKEIPNSVYNDILSDDADEKKPDKYPINFQSTANSMHIEKNLQEWVDKSYAYNMHKMNLDYRTISDEWAYELVEITGDEKDLDEALKYVAHVIENQVIISGTCQVEPSMTYYSTGVNVVSRNTFTLENFKTNDWVVFDGGIYPIYGDFGSSYRDMMELGLTYETYSTNRLGLNRANEGEDLQIGMTYSNILMFARVINIIE